MTNDLEQNMTFLCGLATLYIAMVLLFIGITIAVDLTYSSLASIGFENICLVQIIIGFGIFYTIIWLIASELPGEECYEL